MLTAEYVEFPKGSDNYVFEIEKISEDGSITRMHFTREEAQKIAETAHQRGIKFVPHLGYQGL